MKCIRRCVKDIGCYRLIFSGEWSEVICVTVMEKVYTVRMQEIIHYIAYELEAPDAVLHLLGFKIFLKIINTHLLTVEGAFRLVS